MILDLGEKSLLKIEIVMHLNKNSIFVSAQASAAKHLITEVEVWKSSAELGLTGYLSVD